MKCRIPIFIICHNHSQPSSAFFFLKALGMLVERAVSSSPIENRVEVSEELWLATYDILPFRKVEYISWSPLVIQKFDDKQDRATLLLDNDCESEPNIHINHKMKVKRKFLHFSTIRNIIRKFYVYNNFKTKTNKQRVSFSTFSRILQVDV